MLVLVKHVQCVRDYIKTRACVCVCVAPYTCTPATYTAGTTLWVPADGCQAVWH